MARKLWISIAIVVPVISRSKLRRVGRAAVDNCRICAVQPMTQSKPRDTELILLAGITMQARAEHCHESRYGTVERGSVLLGGGNSLLPITEHTRRISSTDGIGWNVACHHAASSDHRVLSYDDV